MKDVVYAYLCMLQYNKNYFPQSLLTGRCRSLMIKSKRASGKEVKPSVPRGPARRVTERVIGLSRAQNPPKAGNRPPHVTGVLCTRALRACIIQGMRAVLGSGLPQTCAPLTFRQDSKKTAKEVEKAAFYLEQCFNVDEKQLDFPTSAI